MLRGWAFSVVLLIAALGPTNYASGQSSGPDLIGGSLWGASINWGTSGDITGYSFGASACNAGSVEVSWLATNNHHPVQGTQLYRLKNGRFEQIGLAWAMHEYFALAFDECDLGCITPDPYTGLTLGIGCSNPDNATIDGKQTRLGPRGHINAYTGHFPYPFTQVPYPPGPYDERIGRRLQVHEADLDPTLNEGALYFAEIQYIAADDAVAGNGNNNVSYRPVTVSGTSGAYALSLVETTLQQTPAIHAWQIADDSVEETVVQIPGEGRFTLAAKASDLGDGMWHYEYAVYNMNSDRSGQSFFVPVPTDVLVSNIGFHDVDYHSGDSDPNAPGTIRGTDWPGTRTADGIIWATDSWNANDRQANALRWGTVYNFRFDADRGPAGGPITIALYKPGTPTAVGADTIVPHLTVGACCLGTTTCLPDTPPGACAAQGGRWLGVGAACSPDVCLLTGACCDAATGSCAVLTEPACSTAGGTYLGDSTTCNPNPCPQPSPRLTLVADRRCYQPAETMTVELWMNDIQQTVVGGQFFWQYDENALQLLAVDPSGDSSDPFDPADPFDQEIYECSTVAGSELPQCTPAPGLIDYALGTREQSPPFPGKRGAARLAVLSFSTLQPICNRDDLVSWRVHVPPTRMSDADGNPVYPLTFPLDVEDDVPPTLIDCPPTPITVSSDDVPPPAAVTSTDNCDLAPQVTLLETREDGRCAEVYVLTRTWTATDLCGNQSSCQQIINVEGPCRGACCDPIFGACTLLAEQACGAAGGNYQGDGTSCTPNNCPPPNPRLTLVADRECYDAGDSVTVEIWMNDIPQSIVGGQFFLHYNPAKLALGRVDPSGDVTGPFDALDPFDTEIYECTTVAGAGLPQCTPTPGTIDYAVGTRDQSPPFPGRLGSARMAVLRFTALQPLCDETDLIAWRPHAPPTRLSDAEGVPNMPPNIDLDVVDHTPPTIDPPAANEITECDRSDNEALFYAWLADNGHAAAMDNCSSITWSNDYDPSRWVSGPGALYVQVTFTAADFCGNTSSTTATFAIINTTLGDLNCDCMLTISDSQPFVQALLDPAAYVAQHPFCNIHLADVNQDTLIDGADIQAFINALLAL